CGGFGHLENGRTFFRYGGLCVTFSCNPGFRMHGHRTSSCVSGQWVRRPPLCVAPGCRSPGKILHGNALMSPDGSLVHFTCNTGFGLFGSPFLYCKGKSWNGSTPVCKELDIMNLFQQKQTSLYKPGMELNQDITDLKTRFNPVAITAAKETFLRSSLPGAPHAKPQMIKDVSEDLKRHPNALESLWHERIIARARLEAKGFEHTPNNMAEPVTRAEPSTPFALSSKPPTIMATSGINDQQEVSPTFPNQTPPSTLNAEHESGNCLTSTASMHHEIPITPSQALGESTWTNVDMTETTADSARTYTQDASRVSSNVSKNNQLSSHSRIKASADKDILQPLQVSEGESSSVAPTSSIDFSHSENQPQTTFTPSSLPFIPSGSQERERITSAAGNGENFPTTHIPVIPLSTPDVITRDLNPKPLPAGNAMADKDLLEPSGGHIDEELYDISSSNSIHDQENATIKQIVVNQTSGSTTKPNDPVANSEISGFAVSYGIKRRPDCPYPPLPAHGTFYFHTIPNPAPFQFKHYIQYACYAGYTLANGDVYSYCLQDGQWSGVTPKCIGLTPCVMNNGGCSQVCRLNTHNRAECRCDPGFQLLGDQMTCRDLDECVEGLHECQQVCENTFGSYRCSCTPGFQLSFDRISCTDVNECMLPAGMARCGFGCVNTPGSFHCLCPAGYSANITDGQCEDINECEEMQHHEQHKCEWRCVNLPGTHRCVCPRGYTWHPNGKQCNDINECRLRNGGCSHTCKNHRGGFKCACPENSRVSPYNRKTCQLV
ncbi:hypothetical protein C0J45_21437, partial [Silurus meridionalis]